MLNRQQVKKNSHCRSVSLAIVALSLFSRRVSSSGTKKVGNGHHLASFSAYSSSSDCLVSSSVSPGKPMIQVQKGNQLWRFSISIPFSTTSGHCSGRKG